MAFQRNSRRGTVLIVAAALATLLCSTLSSTSGFVGAPRCSTLRSARSQRWVSTTSLEKKESDKVVSAGDSDAAPATKDADIDDAVLRMAMAMAEEEEKGGVQAIDK